MVFTACFVFNRKKATGSTVYAPKKKQTNNKLRVSRDHNDTDYGPSTSI